MLEQSGPGLDPAIFKMENRQEFAAELAGALRDLESANETIRMYEGVDETAAGREWGLTIEEDGDDEVKEAYETLIEHAGEDVVHSLMGGISGGDADPDQEKVTEEQHQAALEQKASSSVAAIDLICGYKDFMAQGMMAAYGETDGGDIEEQAWLATWNKLKEVLTQADGTLLVEAVVLVDEVAKEKFGSDYDPQEYDRGPAVNRNVCARTFYETLQPHLPRAIMRSGEDEWAGF